MLIAFHHPPAIFPVFARLCRGALCGGVQMECAAPGWDGHLAQQPGPQLGQAVLGRRVTDEWTGLAGGSVVSLVIEQKQDTT